MPSTSLELSVLAVVLVPPQALLGYPEEGDVEASVGMVFAQYQTATICPDFALERDDYGPVVNDDIVQGPQKEHSRRLISMRLDPAAPYCKRSSSGRHTVDDDSIIADEVMPRARMVVQVISLDRYHHNSPPRPCQENDDALDRS